MSVKQKTIFNEEHKKTLVRWRAKGYMTIMVIYPFVNKPRSRLMPLF